MGLESKIDGNTNQLLCSTFGAVSHCINHAFKDQEYAQDLSCMEPFTGLFCDKRDLGGMKQLGWCPAQADALWKSHIPFNVFFYLE